MISIIVTDARIVKHDNEWRVMHPANDAILAYCTTEDEAERVRYTFARLASLLPPPNEKE
jgi:hypothetical protein